MAGFAVLCLWPSWAGAQAVSGSPASEAAQRSPIDARAWLMRLHEAARLRNYQGTLVVSTATSVTSSRVAHFCDGDQQYERVEALDGEARSMLRHNEIVHTLWPRARVAVVEQRDVRASFPALVTAGGEAGVLESYELRALGMDRVAGYEAEVVVMKARDALRFSQRLWAERQTGLLLRADILAPNGQMLESSAFSELALGGKPKPALVLEPLRQLDRYRVLRPAVLPTSLDNEGWQMNTSQLPRGFRQVQCAKRTLDPGGGPNAPVVLQSIYADGLTHVSLFVEPFDGKRHQAEVAGSIGATHTLTTRREDHWVTVMGDVPTETLRRFASALERKR
ncbi:MAG: MucB/RseB C-terminal domain-containing protein [Pseudomonadota bacterium]